MSIVELKKVTFLGHTENKTRVIDDLQELGCLHLIPLTIEGDDVLEETVSFDGTTFPAGVVTDATYRFDSYRLTYRYTFHDEEQWTWRVGFTGKIRDAEIEIEQGGTSARKTDTGFVPLLHLAGDWRFVPRWRLALDLESRIPALDPLDDRGSGPQPPHRRSDVV